jgi:hypothetical protein
MIERAIDVIVARGVARMAQYDSENRSPHARTNQPETAWLTDAELGQLERLRLSWMRKQVTTEEIRFLVMRKREARRREMQDAALYPYRRKMIERGVGCRIPALGRILAQPKPWMPQELADAVWDAAWAAATEVAMKLVWDVMQEKQNREED